MATPAPEGPPELTHEVAALTAGRPSRALGLGGLAAVVFFNVSGGPYGIEDVVSAFGPGLALLLLALTPLVWSLPVALVMGELAESLPEDDGYVAWTHRAFGPFWSFQVGWWSWLNSFVDVALYPALFVSYLGHWLPGLGALERWGLAALFVAALTGLNLAGVRPVGRGAVALAVLALAPVVLLVVAGAVGAHSAPWSPWAAREVAERTVEDRSLAGSLGLGLAVVMWNYSGWDTPATVLGETRAPGRTYRRALMIALPVVALAYVLPVAAGLAAAGADWKSWTAGSWPAIGRAVGGAWLGHALAAGAVVSAAGLFLTLLLTNSRLPAALARRGTLPARLAALHPRWGAPWAAILLSAGIYVVLAAVPFGDLVVLDVWLYTLALYVELGAFIRLRWRERGLAGPRRVPGGRAGAVAVVVLPVGLGLAAMATAGWLTTAVGVAVAATGPLAWMLSSRMRSREASPASE